MSGLTRSSSRWPFRSGADLLDLAQNLVADRRARFDRRRVPEQYGHGSVSTRSRLCFTRLRVMMIEPEVRHLQRLGRRSILLQLLLHRLEHLLAVLLVLHVDEVEHDDAAQIAQPDLPDDFLHRLEVGLDDRVFEAAARFLADVAAGVDVDGDERLGLVDDDRAARLQPDLALERLVDLRLDAVLLEDRERLVVAASPAGRASGRMRLDELQHALIFLTALSIRMA